MDEMKMYKKRCRYEAKTKGESKMPCVLAVSFIYL